MPAFSEDRSDQVANMAVSRLAVFCFWAMFCSSVALFYPSFENNLPPNYVSTLSQSIPMQESSFNQFSTCFYLNPRSFIPDSQQIPMLSYLSKDTSMTEIDIHFDHEREITFLSIGGEKAELYSQVPRTNQWTHVCLTWDGKLGLAKAYVDGQMTGVAERIKPGYQIIGEGFWKVEQDDYNGGRFTQFQFWNRLISLQEVQQAQNCSVPGKILSWNHPNMDQQELPGFPHYQCAPSSDSCPDFPVTSELDQENFNEEFGVQVIEGKYKKDFPKQTKFSVCAWIYIEENTDMEPIVIYDEKNTYKFGVLFAVNGTVTLQLGKGDKQDAAIIPVHIYKYNDWQHYCFTWSRKDGKAQIFIDGDLQHVIRDFKKGYFLPAGSNLYIYQVQYGMIDQVEPVAGFALKVTDVNWWNHVISEENASEVYSCSGSYPGNIINWKEDVLMFNSSWKDLRPPCLNRKETITSPYDLNSGFEDGRTHFVTATLMNANFKDMTAFTYCYHFFNKWVAYDIGSFISYEDISHQRLISSGYRFNEQPQIFFGVGSQEFVLRNMVYFDNSSGSTCVTWSAETGQVSFSWGGEVVARSEAPVSQGYTIPGDGKLKITQEQYSSLDKKIPTEGFLYKISDFYMWDRLLSEDELTNFYTCTSSVMPFVVDPAVSKWQIEDQRLQCRRNTYISPYDVKTAINDGHSHLVTATLKDVVFPEMKALSFCFNIFTEKYQYTMIPITYISGGKNELEYGLAYITYCEIGDKANSVAEFPKLTYNPKGTVSTCVTWTSETGIVAIYDNYFGDNFAQSSSNYTIPGKGTLKIIQEQYASLDEENPKKGFVYKVSDFYMWDRELSKDEVKKFWKCPDKLAPFLVDPSSSKWDMEDQPK